MALTPEEEAELKELQTLVQQLPDDEVAAPLPQGPAVGMAMDQMFGPDQSFSAGLSPQGDSMQAWGKEALMAPVNMVKGIPNVFSKAADVVQAIPALALGHDYVTGEDIDIKKGQAMLLGGLEQTRDMSASFIPGGRAAANYLTDMSLSPSTFGETSRPASDYGKMLREDLVTLPTQAAIMGASKAFQKAPVIGTEAAAENSLDTLIGYQRTAKQGAPVALDEAGNVLPKQSPIDASSLISKKDLKVQDLVDGGFPETLSVTDSASSAATKLFNFKKNAGQQIGGIVDNAMLAEEQYLSTLAPHEANAYLRSNSPTWANAQDYLDGIKATNPREGAVLQRKFDAIKTNWGGSGQTLGEFKQLQENMGLSNQASFNAASAKESFGKTLDNLIYSDIAQSLEGRIDTLGKINGVPDLGQQFSTANKSYAASATFMNDAFDASRQSVTGLMKKNFWQSSLSPLNSIAPAQAYQLNTGLNQLMELTSTLPIANPLIQSVVPRNWDEVKSNNKHMANIAMKAGIPVSQYDSLPEPLQKQLHEQVVMNDPMGAETVPGNWNVINGKFMNPVEKDAFIKDNLDKSPSERAKIIGNAFQNKYTPPSEPTPVEMRENAPIDLGNINGMLGDALSNPSPTDYSYDRSTDETLNQLNDAISRHAQDDLIH